MTFVVQTVIAVANIVASFYGFWLVWRVLLPELPGPAEAEKRIAPYAAYFTDPFVRPLARLLHVADRAVAALGLVAVAAVIAALARLADAV